jgi:transcriptional regulator with XRE-family HTH domain
VPTPRVLSHDIGEFIRDMRQNARISLRQLAEQAGVSNPYLSQIERGLRKPSAEVLQQLASALRVSTPMMYLRAGLLDLTEGQGVAVAIANDPDLTDAQKQTLTQIYETFRRENARDAEAARPGNASTAGSSADPVSGPAASGSASVTVRPASTAPTITKPRRANRPAKAGTDAPESTASQSVPTEPRATTKPRKEQ